MASNQDNIPLSPREKEGAMQSARPAAAPLWAAQRVAAIREGEAGFEALQEACFVTTVAIGGKDYALIASRGCDRVQIVETICEDGLVPVGWITTKLRDPCFITTVVMGDKNYALIASRESDAVQIVEITEPASPVVVVTIGDCDCDCTGRLYRELRGACFITLVVVGDKSYARVSSTGAKGSQIIEITDPEKPRVVDGIRVAEGLAALKLNNAFSIATVEIKGRIHNLMGSICTDTVEIVDVTDIENPVVVSRLCVGDSKRSERTFAGLNGVPSMTTIAIGVKRYALLVLHRDEALRIVDITDPARPVAHSTLGFEGEGDASGFAGFSRRLFVSTVAIGRKSYALVTSTFHEAVQLFELGVFFVASGFTEGFAAAGTVVGLSLSFDQAIAVEQDRDLCVYVGGGKCFVYDATGSDPAAGKLAFLYEVQAGESLRQRDLMVTDLLLEGVVTKETGAAVDLSSLRAALGV